MMPSLRRAVVQGTVWLTVVSLVAKGSQALVTLALGRYLTAAQLGVVTVIVAVLALTQTLQTMGLYDVMARTRRDTRDFAGTLASLSVIAALVLAAVIVAFAPEVASAIGATEASTPLRVAALGLPLTAYLNVQISLLHRGLDFRKRVLPDAGSAVVGALVTMTCARTGLGAWSIVAGLLTTAVLGPFLGLAVGIRIPFAFRYSDVRETLQWVKIVGPAALLGVVLLNLDYFIVAQHLGITNTGYYSFAYRIAFLPYITFAVVFGAVSLQLYARLMAADRGHDLQRAVSRTFHSVFAVTGGLYLVIFLAAGRIVVINVQWRSSVDCLRVLCGYGFLLGLVYTGYQVLRATGRAHAFLRLQATHVVLLLVLALSLVHVGIIGVAWAQVTAASITVALLAWTLGRMGALGLETAVRARGPVVAMAAVSLAYAGAERVGWIPPNDSFWGGVLIVTVTGVAYAGMLYLFDADLVSEVRLGLQKEGTQTP